MRERERECVCCVYCCVSYRCGRCLSPLIWFDAHTHSRLAFVLWPVTSHTAKIPHDSGSQSLCVPPHHVISCSFHNFHSLVFTMKKHCTVCCTRFSLFLCLLAVLCSPSFTLLYLLHSLFAVHFFSLSLDQLEHRELWAVQKLRGSSVLSQSLFTCFPSPGDLNRFEK